MPYIKQVDRVLASQTPKTPGDLNYAFTTLIKTYMENNKLSYQTINDIVGALEGAKLEFYRRIVINYENTKLAQNGDVY